MDKLLFNDKCSKCFYYVDQKDRNGDVVITYCVHHENKSESEGNTTIELCPIIHTFDKPKG